MISEKEAGKECPQCRRAWKVQQSPFSNNKFIHCIYCKESAEKILKKSEMKGKVAEAFKKPGTEYDAILKQYELYLDGLKDDIFLTKAAKMQVLMDMINSVVPSDE